MYLFDVRRNSLLKNSGRRDFGFGPGPAGFIPQRLRFLAESSPIRVMSRTERGAGPRNHHMLRHMLRPGGKSIARLGDSELAAASMAAPRRDPAGPGRR